MSVLSATSLKQAFLAAITADAAVLAALGAGAASVITTEGLRGTLPAAPFIAIGYGPLTGAAQRDVRTLFPTVWLYDDAGQRWFRLNALAALVEAALPEDCIAYAETRLAGLDAEITDNALNRPALAMRYQVKARF